MSDNLQVPIVSKTDIISSLVSAARMLFSRQSIGNAQSPELLEYLEHTLQSSCEAELKQMDAYRIPFLNSGGATILLGLFVYLIQKGVQPITIANQSLFIYLYGTFIFSARLTLMFQIYQSFRYYNSSSVSFMKSDLLCGKRFAFTSEKEEPAVLIQIRQARVSELSAWLAKLRAQNAAFRGDIKFIISLFGFTVVIGVVLSGVYVLRSVTVGNHASARQVATDFLTGQLTAVKPVSRAPNDITYTATLAGMRCIVEVTARPTAANHDKQWLVKRVSCGSMP